MDNQQDNDLTGMIDRIICGFSDRMVMDMGIDEDDHRLERICDKVRAELTTELETIIRGRDEARAEVLRFKLDQEQRFHTSLAIIADRDEVIRQRETIRAQLTVTQARLDKAVAFITRLAKGSTEKTICVPYVTRITMEHECPLDARVILLELATA